MSDEEFVFHDESEAADGNDGDGEANYEDDGEEGVADEEDSSPAGRYQSAKDSVGFDDDHAIQIFYELFHDKSNDPSLRAKALRRAAATASLHEDPDQIFQALDLLFDAVNEAELSRSDCDKTVTAMMGNVVHSEALLRQFLEYASDKLNRNTQIPLYLSLKLRQGELMMRIADYDLARVYLQEAEQFCPIPPDPADAMMCQSAIRLLVIKIELADLEHNEAKMFEYYNQATSVGMRAISTHQNAVLSQVAGLRSLKERDFRSARAHFYDAFKAFDDMGHIKRVHCLAYWSLAAMLCREHVNLFLAVETATFVAHPMVAPLAQLTDAYQADDIVLFNQRLDAAHRIFVADPEFYGKLLDRVRLDVLAAAILNFCRKYRKVDISYIATSLASPREEVSRLVFEQILDRRIAGLVDEETDVITMKRPRKVSRHTANLPALLTAMEKYVADLNLKCRLALNST
jgi:COP9 signalosome complex subunit 2